MGRPRIPANQGRRDRDAPLALTEGSSAPRSTEDKMARWRAALAFFRSAETVQLRRAAPSGFRHGGQVKILEDIAIHGSMVS